MPETATQKKLEVVFASSVHWADHLTESGKRRWRDNCVARKKKDEAGQDVAVFAIADGFAEYQTRVANIASSLAVETCRDSLDTLVSAGGRDVEDLLDEIFSRVNREIYQMSREETVTAESTLTAGFFKNGKLHVGHVGNCRVYRFRNKNVELVTADQSLIIPPFPGQINPGGIITRRLGSPENPQVSYYNFEPQENEIVIFCTDGLYRSFSEKEMEHILASGRSLEKMCEQMIDQAKLRGLDDDAAVILAKFAPESEEETGKKSLPEGKADEEEKGGALPINLLISIIMVMVLGAILAVFGIRYYEANNPPLETPKVTILSDVELESVTYNTREIKKYFQNNKGRVVLNSQVNRFEIVPVELYSITLSLDKIAEIEVNTGEQNNVVVQDEFIRIWISTKSSVKVRKDEESQKTIVEIKNLQQSLQLNLLTPRSAVLKIEEAY